VVRDDQQQDHDRKRQTGGNQRHEGLFEKMLMHQRKTGQPEQHGRNQLVSRPVRIGPGWRGGVSGLSASLTHCK